MIDRKSATAQIRRLSGLRYFPSEDEARRELVTALAESVLDQEHGERLISELLSSGGTGDCPTPPDIRRIAYALRPPEARRAALGCNKCGGVGWVETTTVATEGVFAGKQYSAVRLCECRKAVAHAG